MASFDGKSYRSTGSGKSGGRGGGGGSGTGRVGVGDKTNSQNRSHQFQGPANGESFTQKRFPILRGIRKTPVAPPGFDDRNKTFDDKICVVCYKEVKHYCVGACDHAVCYECSARMRVLMDQNECPICRQSLDKVIVTRGLIKPFKELKEKLRMFILLPKWGLYLEDDGVKRDFETLLEHRCPFCKDTCPEEDQDTIVFKTFRELKTHIQRRHDFFACDLCAEHIKLFSNERRFYTRQELATHKRKGDRNDKSHRGHPMCEFCDKRFFDEDELYKHLRKDHYFCHFCDADGFNHYYNTYDDLRIHFRKEHFLCEEENCKDEQFTSVFRSEIDIKAHLTAVHSRLLGKHGMKQARVIDLEFNIKSDDERRSRRFNGEGFIGRGAGGGGRRERGERPGFGDRDIRLSEDFEETNQPSFEPTIHEKPKVDSVAEFPMLEGASAKPLLSVINGTSHSNSSIAQKLALSSGKNVVTAQLSTGGITPRWNAKTKHEEQFPALGLGITDSFEPAAPSRPFTAAAAIVASKPPPSSQPKMNGLPRRAHPPSAIEEFPSLGISSTSVNGSAWAGSGVKMKGKSTPRSLKVAPHPLERRVEVDPTDSFHFVPLSVSRARKDSLTKKYETILAEPEEEEETKSEKPKKKKKNKNESSTNSAQVKAAAALFNGGKAPKDKKLLAKVDLKDDFPSLEPIKKPPPPVFNSSGGGDESRVVSPPATNPNIAGITVSSSSSGPPPGFAARHQPEDIFDLSCLNPSSSSSPTKRNKNGNNNNNNNISEDLELLKAKAGSLGKLFIQPPDFTRRTKRLLDAVKSSLNGDEASYEMFSSVNQQYRKGELISKEYYELCRDMFGVMDFKVIFPEMVALLPSIERQQELLAAHRRAGGAMTDLKSCHECFQVVKTGDVSAHVKSHSAEELFPAL